MRYEEVKCPYCGKLIEFKPEESWLECPFCYRNVEKKLAKKLKRRGRVDKCEKEDALHAAGYKAGERRGKQDDKIDWLLMFSLCVLVPVVTGVILGGMPGSATKIEDGGLWGALIGGFIGIRIAVWLR